MAETTVTFDGYDLSTDAIVGNLVRQFMPIEVAQIDVPAMDGALFASGALGTISIAMDLTVTGLPEERSAKLRTIAGHLRVDEPRRLAISDDGGKYYLAFPSGGDIERRVGAETFQLTFECLDPVMYGRTVEQVIAGSATVTVGGNCRTMPTITATGASADPETGFYGVSVDGGRFDIPMSSGDVSADCSARTLEVGGRRVLPTLGSDWIELEPGAHTVEISGDGACTLSWTERWI